MLVVNGGRELQGEVEISGSKNSSLPILIASLLSDETSFIKNVPNLTDTRFLCELLCSFGVAIHLEPRSNEIALDARNITSALAHYDMVRKMRASVLTLAPLLARRQEAVVSLPGGCAIGSRPVDIHLKGLEALGTAISVRDGYIHAKLKQDRFIGCDFALEMPSVGATEQLIMAAVLARGVTHLSGVALEPEVVELCQALVGAGAIIDGIGTNSLVIRGVEKLSGLRHTIHPDRVEAGTFMAIASATKSVLTLKNVKADDLSNVMARFIKAGVNFSTSRREDAIFDEIVVTAPSRLLATDIETAAHPGFPTDMQAQFMAAMTLADGESLIYERVFENRMMHVPELRRMGANIELKHNRARVIGQKNLVAAPVMATDLRASASLVIAALAAPGRSEIRRIYHLDRGYQELEQKLKGLGASIERCTQV